MLKQLKAVYDFLPKKYLTFLKYIPDRVLFGQSYINWKSKISFDKNLVNKNLYETLLYAKKHTMYGKDNIPDYLTEENSIETLNLLPIITSYDIATNLDYYVSDEFNKFNSYYTTTGGTGRNPTTLLLSNELFGIEWAHVHHIWSFAEYDRKKHIKLTLRGKSLKGEKLVEYNPIYNELVVDTFKVKLSNFSVLLNELKKYDIKYIHGYPSLVKEYMIYFENFNYKPKLNGILLASEGVSVEDKQLMKDFFNCKVISFYGQSERALLAVDIEANDLHRVYTSYGYPKVVDGELMITSFVNRALPLINYKIGDGAEIVEDGENIYLKNLKGRWGKDFVYLDENKKIPTASINLHSKIQDEIVFYQIHQKEFAKIEIKVLQKATSKMDSKELIETFRSEMKGNLKDFDIDVRLVSENEIIKSHRGKMMLLIQELKFE
jgi:phenylacetate-coenzyme A ligase PaaK-like adenylate-forming protein